MSKQYKVCASLSISESNLYTSPLVSVSFDETVDAGVDPVECLRKLVNREFKRKFADLTFEYEDEAIGGTS